MFIDTTHSEFKITFDFIEIIWVIRENAGLKCALLIKDINILMENFD